MRFFYAKKEQICRHCKSVINYGEEAVVKRWKAPSGALIPLVVHTACYIPWEEEAFRRQWSSWKLGATPRRIRKKRGRKPIYSSREQAEDMNRRRSLLSYHRKAGNEARVQEIQVGIAELERRE